MNSHDQLTNFGYSVKTILTIGYFWIFKKNNYHDFDLGFQEINSHDQEKIFDVSDLDFQEKNFHNQLPLDFQEKQLSRFELRLSRNKFSQSGVPLDIQEKIFDVSDLDFQKKNFHNQLPLDFQEKQLSRFELRLSRNKFSRSGVPLDLQEKHLLRSITFGFLRKTMSRSGTFFNKKIVRLGFVFSKNKFSRSGVPLDFQEKQFLDKISYLSIFEKNNSHDQLLLEIQGKSLKIQEKQFSPLDTFRFLKTNSHDLDLDF
ncbi:hypothetical protein FQA39_LY15199 [Lamprigera yunnana]|nr:hypothetical protein FQA39_LY15199 [Lamprigera yunnana]